MKKCIIFDVDRTMVDSYKPELLSLKEAIENVTNKKIDDEDMKKLTSLPTSIFFKYLNLTDEELKLINKEWEKTYSKYPINCFSNIKEIIRTLYNNGLEIGIITSRTKKEFQELDKLLEDVLDCFKIIVTSDLINNPKPHRDSIDYLCNKLKITPDDIIYIGDSEVDKDFSDNCHITFIPACWENKELENITNACNSTDKLMEIINQFI